MPRSRCGCTVAEKMTKEYLSDLRHQLDEAGVILQGLKTQIDNNGLLPEQAFQELGRVMQTARRLRFGLLRFMTS
jgi:hypothetical protein